MDFELESVVEDGAGALGAAAGVEPASFGLAVSFDSAGFESDDSDEDSELFEA